MLAYILRRLLLIIPTLFGIMLINFVIVQAAPGGPVEQVIARIKGTDVAATARVGGSGRGETTTGQATSTTGGYRGARGIDPALIRQLEKLYGFDQPPAERFVHMIRNYLVFDFGNSFFQDRSVTSLILERLPVSISLGLWSTLLVYLISIPLGIAKAVRDGSGFDVWTSAVVIVGYAIPSFLFAILLIVLFAGGSFVQWFPLRGIVSDNWAQMSWPAAIGRNAA
jgi:microcin C transport system permease protein